MRRTVWLLLALGLCSVRIGPAPASAADAESASAPGRIYYVRQTLGSDANDGLSPATAWRSISKLDDAMQAGDTAYVGPGLYRDQIIVRNSGTAERRIRFVADPTGQRTGDPPGVVMITGAEPVDESVFEPHSVAGVYRASFPAYPMVAGVVEMDGPQYRYMRARSTPEHLVEGLSEVEVVARLPSTYHYDPDAQILYLHTSDGKPPASHEIELMRRTGGISMTEKHFVTIEGFTFRHTGDAGILVSEGSGEVIAIGNTSYGSRQGIRVRSASNVLISGNTLFRNENCGVYFLSGATDGLVVGNRLYENVKGVRWGSRSDRGLAVGNTAFDNLEAGISIEDTADVRVFRNRLVGNRKSQLLLLKSQYHSEDNCFQNTAPEQITANLYFEYKHYRTLAEYQDALRRDLSSREGECGALPEKADVRKLHAETTAYAEHARKILAGDREDGLKTGRR